MMATNVLFTSVGRRVSLIRLFRDAIHAVGTRGTIVTADMQSRVPARFVGDIHEIVPAVSDPAYVDRLLYLCRKHDIRLIVPLIDPDLALLSNWRSEFEAIGVTVLVSSKTAAEITLDKRRTHDFFVTNGISTPRLFASGEQLPADAVFPVIVKPATGSGSIGVVRAFSRQDLDIHVDSLADPIIQEIAPGDEYTLDILVDLAGNVRSVVPRKRLEVRSGEMSKGVTVKHPGLIAEGARVAGLLPGARGPITLQCFLDKDDAITSIEINARFGGGFPLSAAAGANFPHWILEWMLGRDPDIELTDWEDGLYMLRYDEAFFARGESLV